MGMLNTRNIAIMDGSPWDSATRRVEIQGGIIEVNWEKKLTLIPRPRSKGNWSEARSTKILDLKMITKSYTINGYFVGSPTEPTVGSTADLMYAMYGSMVEAGGTVNLTWVRQDGQVEWHTGNFTKANAKKEPKTDDVYTVQFNIVDGVNL